MSHLYLCGEPDCKFQTELYIAFKEHNEQHEAKRNLERIARRNAGLKGARE